MRNKRELINDVLRKLDFVVWDRYFGESELTFFGWIKRKDNHWDFVTVGFDNNGLILNYVTSSAKYTNKIAEILNFNHFPCNRVEDFCGLDVLNVLRKIKL